jgi:hypothetical protein
VPLMVVGGEKKRMAKAATVASGFTPQGNGSGLIVPAAYQRAREVITKDEWRTLERCIKSVLGPRSIRFGLACSKPGCRERPITKVADAGGGFTLRCGCTDRVFTPRI